jgi:hypothetical protein
MDFCRERLPSVSGDGAGRRNQLSYATASLGELVSASSSAMSRVRVGSTWIPGPIVEVRVIFLM